MRYNPKIVIRTPNWLGDLSMGLIHIQSLKDYSPLIITKRGFESLLKNIGNLAVFDSKKELLSISLRLRKEKFDIGIVMPPSNSSYLFMKLVNPRKLLRYRRIDGKSYHDEIKQLFLKTNLHLRFQNYFSISFDTDELNRLKEKLGFIPGKFIILAPFSNYKVKEWGLDKFLELCKIIEKNTDYSVYFVGGQKEVIYSNLITHHKNLVGKLSLRELALLLYHAKIVIGNDSGVPHLADALGVKNLIIFGPTDPNWTKPTNGEFLWLGLPCSPCGGNRNSCPLKHKNCLNEIDVYTVWKRLEKYL